LLKSGLTALLTLGLLAAGTADAQVRPAPPSEIAAVPVTLLIDLGSGQVLTARRPNLSFVPASMTKVMTAYVAFEEMAAGRLTPDRQFTVSEKIAREWSGRGTSLDVVAGQQLSTDTLLHGIATVSANDGAAVLAEGYAGSLPAWAALMNGAAEKLGMANSRFASPSGWPDGGATYVSARDLATLAQAMITRHPALYHRYFGQKYMAWNGRMLKSHDPTVGVVPGADGIKTGYTREAGFNFLGSAQRDDRRLVMVVAGAKSADQRAAAARALLEWGFSAWTARPLFQPQTRIAEARVQGGDAREVTLVAASPVYAVVPRGSREPITLRVVYRGPLVAPISKDAPVAQLEVRVGDAEPGRVPLYAARAVGVAGPFDRLINGLIGMVS
jgi:D-alanyl-D-alanine carboxypeptidase (penicillin-binding protein 5/6)